jgi:hypothetical protein
MLAVWSPVLAAFGLPPSRAKRVISASFVRKLFYAIASAAVLLPFTWGVEPVAEFAGGFGFGA